MSSAGQLLPYRAHLAIDALGAIALAATPFVTGQWKKGAARSPTARSTRAGAPSYGWPPEAGRS